MTLEGARLARAAADRGQRTPERPRFVAGSVGPLNVTLSLSPRVEDAAYRAVTFDEVRATYAEQIAALRRRRRRPAADRDDLRHAEREGGDRGGRERRPRDPALALVHGRRPERSQSLGPDLEAFWISVEHAEPFIVGVNCSLGATEMRPFVESLASLASTYVSCHPNAGLPNALGLHDEQPGDTSRFLREFAEDGLVNLVGGCCGTTPEHTQAIAAAVEGLRPRRVPERSTAAALRRPRAVRGRPGHGLRHGRRADERDRLRALPTSDRGG